MWSYKNHTEKGAVLQNFIKQGTCAQVAELKLVNTVNMMNIINMIKHTLKSS